MRRLRALVAPVLLVVACSAGHPDAGDAAAPEAPPVAPILAKKLVLGVSGYYGTNVTSAMRALVEHLSQQLRIPVELRIAEAYSELPALLTSGAVDIAQLPPLSYVRLREHVAGLIPVATPIIGGSPTYLGHIYVREDSKYQSLEELKGTRIAYVSKESSSGYLFARDVLRRRGFDPQTFFGASRFYSTHPQVLEAVLKGEAEAGAAFDATSDWTGPIDRPEGLRVIAKTERIPNDCLVARAGFDPGTIDAFRRALLELRPGEPQAEGILSGMRVNGWVRADEARYDRVRAVLTHEGVEK